MKLRFILIAGLFSLNIAAQSNEELAGVYLNRCERSYLDNDLEKAVNYFDKAVGLMGEMTTSRIAKLGMILSYEQKKYFEARSHSYDYFDLTPSGSEEYEEMLELRIDIQESIDREISEMKQREEELRRQEAEQRRLDSLSGQWKMKANKLILNMDSITSFDINNVAVYSKGKALGIIDDMGNTLVEADNYTYYIANENYILLMSDKDKPTKIFAFNCISKNGHVVPGIVNFNGAATHYGQVMLPRGDGRLITYPNNSTSVFRYNLNSKKIEEWNPDKDLLKQLRKNDIVDKYNKEGQVKIDKAWYHLGGDLGAGIYALFEGANRPSGFLNSSNGKVLSKEYYNFLGAYYNGNFELIDGENRFWMDAGGIREEFNIDKRPKYNGLSRIVKLEDGKYQLLQKIDGQDYIVFKDKKLINKKAYLAK